VNLERDIEHAVLEKRLEQTADLQPAAAAGVPEEGGKGLASVATQAAGHAGRTHDRLLGQLGLVHRARRA
jgi:hypothetical protein